MKYYRPLPLDIELTVSPRLLLISKTDMEGNILYANKNLAKISRYEKNELQNTSHSILRHPDMPRVIFFLLWEELKRGKEVTLLVKNLTKTGEYYWVHNEFKLVENDPEYHSAYIATGEMASDKAIIQIEKLYARLLKIEKRENIAASLFYLENYLQERNVNLQEYMYTTLKPQTTMSSIFNKIKNGLITAA
jgi:PAS domain S-box-containing protein